MFFKRRAPLENRLVDMFKRVSSEIAGFLDTLNIPKDRFDELALEPAVLAWKIVDAARQSANLKTDTSHAEGCLRYAMLQIMMVHTNTSEPDDPEFVKNISRYITGPWNEYVASGRQDIKERTLFTHVSYQFLTRVTEGSGVSFGAAHDMVASHLKAILVREFQACLKDAKR